ncbi:MAG: glycosyltransferase family 2 protein [Candidatus Woesearchaeota archaeon]
MSNLFVEKIINKVFNLQKTNLNKNNEDLISIILPSYNYEKYIKQTIKSVLRQSYTNLELIIIDDASTDNSVSIIKKIQNKNNKIKLIENKKNIGLLQSYKKALKKTKGKFVAFIDADDYWHPKNLEYKLSILKNKKEIALVYSNYSENEKEIEKKLSLNKIPFYLFKKNNSYFFSIKIFSFSLILTRKEFLKKIDFSLPKKYDSGTDWWIYSQLSKEGPFAKIPLKLVFKRKHNQQYSKRGFLENYNKFFSKKNFEFRELLRKRIFKKNIFYFYLFVFYWAINWQIRKIILYFLKKNRWQI